jgi:type II secretory pathway pseudopilin PulG
MGMGMGFTMLVWLVVLVVLGVAAVRLVTRQLPASRSGEDRLLANQSEQIEQLEDELRRVKEQADFTEKLLTDRHESDDEDALEEESPN